MTESRATEREPDPTSERAARRGGAPEPDVLLDIPEVTVDEIRLAVDGLDADLSLRARLANLLELDAGVRVHLTKLELDVTGVSAEALLKVRLEKLVQILDRALSTIDQNPQVIDVLARSANAGIDDVNRAARRLTQGGGTPAVEVRAAADQRQREQGPESARASAPPPAGAGPAQPRPGAGGGAAGGNRPGAGTPEQPGRKPERPDAQLGAAQLAEQAGETLRQAGRSVWEAIQGGMSQYREQRPDR